MPYIVSAALLILFVANVAVGAISKTPPLGNVAEMLVLFTAAIAFSVGILRSEAREKTRNKTTE